MCVTEQRARYWYAHFRPPTLILRRTGRSVSKDGPHGTEPAAHPSRQRCTLPQDEVGFAARLLAGAGRLGRYHLNISHSFFVIPDAAKRRSGIGEPGMTFFGINACPIRRPGPEPGPSPGTITKRSRLKAGTAGGKGEGGGAHHPNSPCTYQPGFCGVWNSHRRWPWPVATRQ